MSVGKIANENKKALEPMNQEFVRYGTKLKEIEAEIKSKQWYQSCAGKKQISKIKKFSRSLTQQPTRSQQFKKFTQLDFEERQRERQAQFVRDRYHLELSALSIPFCASAPPKNAMHIFRSVYRPLDVESDMREFSQLDFMKRIAVHRYKE